MSKEIYQIYDQFELRLNRFFEKFDELKKENNKIKEELNRLVVDNQVKDQKIEEFERKIEVMKMAKSMHSPAGEVHDAKIKINRLVREIDGCIALLNK